jgi:hypothetical protein
MNLAMIIWQSGEPFIGKILNAIKSKYEIIDIIRYPAEPQEIFQERMVHIYTKIDPSKMLGVQIKLKENKDRTAYLVVLCKGNPKDNRHLKRGVVRPMTKVNCIHSTDSKEETSKTLSYLFGYDKEEIKRLYSQKPKKFDKVKDFLHKDITIFDRKIINFGSLTEVWEAIDHLNYVTVTFGPLIKDDVANRKDIEFITDNRSALVDTLGGRYAKAESVYIVNIGGKKVKTDHCFSVTIPLQWRKRILKTRVFNKIEGCYMPTNIDRFWLHTYDRSVLKPYKFKNNKRYGKGERCSDLFVFGQKNGIKVSESMSRDQLAEMSTKYARKKK